MELFINDSNGVTLHTENKYCKEDIVVRPETTNLNVTPTTEKQSFEGLFTNVNVDPSTGTITEEEHQEVLNKLQNLQKTYNEQQESIEELNGGYEFGAYKSLKYLINTEFDKYIDVGVGISDTLEVDMKYNLIESSHATMTMVFGARYAALSSAFIFLNRAGDNTFYVQVGDVQKRLDFEHESYNIDYRVVMGNNMLKFYNDSGLIFEGDYSDMGVKPFERNDVSMALFAGRGDFGYTLCSAKMILYYCKIKKNGTLVRDLVPMKRLSDGVCGLFDKVSKTFFKSANNGINDFTGELEEKYYDTSGNEVEVDTSDELYDINYTLETKRLMKETLINKGIAVLETDTFRSYVNKINSLRK